MLAIANGDIGRLSRCVRRVDRRRKTDATEYHGQEVDTGF
jgi:hypothetical protein